jgi:hypothetical protein
MNPFLLGRITRTDLKIELPTDRDGCVPFALSLSKGSVWKDREFSLLRQAEHERNEKSSSHLASESIWR